MLTRYLIEVKYSLITLALLTGLVALATTQAFSGLDTSIDDFFDLMTNLGFVGILLIALVSNSTLLIQIPYTVPLLSLALSGASFNHLLLMGVTSGIGAGLGEIVSYGMAVKILGSNPNLEKSALFQWVKRVTNKHPRITPVLIFIWALSPLPDDTVVIPLAMVRYGIKPILLPMFVGKVLNNVMMTTMFYYFTDWSANSMSAHIQADMALGILIIFVMTILYQVEKTRAVSHVLMPDGSQQLSDGCS